MDNFYVQQDSTKVTSFIQIPKILFRDYRKLSLKCKIAYSLYLSRYAASTYQDETGPYIIFSDEEMSHLIDTTTDYVRKVRKKLAEAGLIGVARGVGNNKIYLYSYEKGEKDNVFFYESSLDSWKFYRFPRELLDERFANLPLEARFLYAMYFDTMCLSQRMYFLDSQERVYFQDTANDQMLKSGFTVKTLRKYRSYLKACHLLGEYRDFGQPIRYYLMKLSMFEDNVFKFEDMTEKEQKAYLSQISKTFAKKYVHPANVDISAMWKALKGQGYTVQAIKDEYEKATGKTVSVPGMRKYLNKTRKAPDELTGLLGLLLGQGDPLNGKFGQYKMVNSAGAKREIVPEQNGKKVRYISYTDNTYTDNNKTDNNYTYLQDSVLKERNLHKQAISYMNSVKDSLLPDDKQFVQDAFEFMETLDTLKLHNYPVTLTQSDMADKLAQTSDRASALVKAALDAMSTKSFESSYRRMKYFVAVLFDKIQDAIEHPWQNTDAHEEARYNSRKPDEFSDEVKNFKLW